MPGASAAPQVNYGDLPEMQLIGGSAQSRRSFRNPSYHHTRAKFRVKSLAYRNHSLPSSWSVALGVAPQKDPPPPPLPILLEDGVDVSISPEVPDEKLPSWSCSSCTFVNSGWLPQCELCGSPTSGPAPIDTFANAFQSLAINKEDHTFRDKTSSAELDWPSLTEAADAFVDCEISSVGSSWLDVGDAEDTLFDGDAILVNSSQKPPPEASWAARAKSIAAIGPVASLPVSGVVAPPLQKAPAMKAGKVKEPEMLDDVDWDLECLEDRRLRIGYGRKSSPKRCQR